MIRFVLPRSCVALLGARLAALAVARAADRGALLPAALALLGLAGLLLLAAAAAAAARRRRPRAGGCGMGCRLLAAAAGLLAIAGAAQLELAWRPELEAARRPLALAADRQAIWLIEGRDQPRRDAAGEARGLVRLCGRLDAGAAPALVTLPAPAAAELRGLRLEPGERAWVRGCWRLHPHQRNPAGRDRAAEAWRRQRALGVLRVAGDWARYPLPAPAGGYRKALAGRRRAVATFWMRLRGRAAARLDRRLPAAAAGLARAMALGDRAALPAGVRDDFRHLGWSHLLAVSGLHVGFAAALAMGLLGALRRARSGPLLAAVLVGYAALTGAPASVVRATLMALAALLARARCRPLSGGRALLLAALAMLVLAPESLGDPGARLSFAAVGGIVLWGPALDLSRPLAVFRGSVLRRWLLLPWQTGLAAQLGCLPVLAATVHAVSPWGVVSGPLAIPLAALLVAATLLGLLAGLLLPPLGGLLLDGAGVAAALLARLAALAARHLPPPWPLAAPGWLPLVLLAAGVLLLVAVRAGSGAAAPAAKPHPRSRHRRQPRSLAACSFLLTSAALYMLLGLPWPPAGRHELAETVGAVRLEVLDVGQGNAALLLLERPRGLRERLGWPAPPARAYLLDAGDAGTGWDAGRAVIVPRLRSLGLRRLDGALLTHADRDHLGGMPAVLAALRVDTLRVPPGFAPPAPLAAALARRPGVQRVTSRAGELLIDHGPLQVRVCHPPAGYAGSDNDRSLVLVVEAFGSRLLLAADLEAAGEAELLDDGRFPGPVDLLEVGHHGSASGSSRRFLRALAPRLALISVGAHNRCGHPAAAVIARLEEVGAQVWRTDRAGALIVRLDPGGLQLAAVAVKRAR